MGPAVLHFNQLFPLVPRKFDAGDLQVDFALVSLEQLIAAFFLFFNQLD